MRIQRSIDTPIRTSLSWTEAWEAEDKGLILCWEKGRAKAESDSQMAAKAMNGELVPLVWKGGVEQPIKTKKYGTLWYLAAWQGLRGQSLDIDTNEEPCITCTRTSVPVIFTKDMAKYAKET